MAQLRELIEVEIENIPETLDAFRDDKRKEQRPQDEFKAEQNDQEKKVAPSRLDVYLF